MSFLICNAFVHIPYIISILYIASSGSLGYTSFVHIFLVNMEKQTGLGDKPRKRYEEVQRDAPGVIGELEAWW